MGPGPVKQRAGTGTDAQRGNGRDSCGAYRLEVDFARPAPSRRPSVRDRVVSPAGLLTLCHPRSRFPYRKPSGVPDVPAAVPCRTRLQRHNCPASRRPPPMVEGHARSGLEPGSGGPGRPALDSTPFIFGQAAAYSHLQASFKGPLEAVALHRATPAHRLRLLDLEQGRPTGADGEEQVRICLSAGGLVTPVHSRASIRVAGCFSARLAALGSCMQQNAQLPARS